MAENPYESPQNAGHETWLQGNEWWVWLLIGAGIPLAMLVIGILLTINY